MRSLANVAEIIFLQMALAVSSGTASIWSQKRCELKALFVASGKNLRSVVFTNQSQMLCLLTGAIDSRDRQIISDAQPLMALRA